MTSFSIKLLRPMERLFISHQYQKRFKKGDKSEAGSMIIAACDRPYGVAAGVYEDNEVVAAMCYAAKRNHVKLFYIGSMKKGCGTLLIQWLRLRFPTKPIFLWASPKSRDFYEKLGFVRANENGDYVQYPPADSPH